MNQAEALELLRKHPDSTIPELAMMLSPRDRTTARRLKDNLNNKLHHLRKFGLVATRVNETNGEIRWYPTED